jgi:meiotically up-regulated gene 157 (Mug157) protein
MIWPMSIMVRALTSESDAEIRECLVWLKRSHAGTGFMHEAFDKDDPSHFTRPWFAWANGLFGELILDLSERKPALLSSALHA